VYYHELDKLYERTFIKNESHIKEVFLNEKSSDVLLHRLPESEALCKAIYLMTYQSYKSPELGYKKQLIMRYAEKCYTNILSVVTKEYL
jgi:hypothetical protein